MEALYVKIGGSFITHKYKPVSINYNALESLVKALRVAITVDHKLILGNGGGSFAHYTVIKYKEADQRYLLVKCHQATRLLNRIIVDYLIANDIPATSIQTSAIISYDQASGGFRVNTEPLEKLVDAGVIPVVYGECLPALEKPVVISTEQVFELLSTRIKPRRVILLTDVKGVYTCDPRTCQNPTLIREITPRNLESVLSILKQHEKSDVTGGMYGKVLYMSRLARELNTEIIILSGFDVDSIVEAMKGGYPEQSTLITCK